MTKQEQFMKECCQSCDGLECGIPSGDKCYIEWLENRIDNMQEHIDNNKLNLPTMEIIETELSLKHTETIKKIFDDLKEITNEEFRYFDTGVKDTLSRVISDLKETYCNNTHKTGINADESKGV